MPYMDGNKLRSLRLAALMSQRALANRAGVAVETISRIESADSRQVSNLTVHKLARSLSIPPEDLYSKESPGSESPLQMS